jgi:hypothetical protein
LQMLSMWRWYFNESLYRNSSHFGTWSFRYLVKSAPRLVISAPS